MPDPTSDAEPDPLAVARELVDRLWNHADERAVAPLLEPGFVGRSPNWTESLDRDGLFRLVRAWRTGLPDLGLRVEDAVVQGQRVCLRTVVTGTHRGWLLGLPPTGLFCRATESLWLRFEHGRVAELWRQSCPLTVLDQLGLLPPEDAGPARRLGHALRTAGRLAALSVRFSRSGASR
ncbi:ester cyclase [Solihabitans fulvus]|uniref:Ester cyclase n=1 Tax=Solihabitans fulvus TaxID=1892852 RepID=A0A5B2XHW6_9PSEU|nr:ester cyclase [Solihabitans fulvus]KAA2262619.1 ester cyclase [Solihabitans fulvus]